MMLLIREEEGQFKVHRLHRLVFPSIRFKLLGEVSSM